MSNLECCCGGWHVVGRACTTEAKRKLLERLLTVWDEHPKRMQRLGQLLENAARSDDLFGVEDMELMRRLEER
jgi:hypothetical protein